MNKNNTNTNSNNNNNKKDDEKRRSQSLDWVELGRGCLEIGRLLSNLDQKELAVKYLKISVNTLDDVCTPL